jgi:hypothetical protein
MRRFLTLVLTRAWFDLMVSGEKRVEYRDVGGRYHKYLQRRDYEWVKFFRAFPTKKGEFRPCFACKLLRWEILDDVNESFRGGLLTVRGRKVAISLGPPCRVFQVTVR